MATYTDAMGGVYGSDDPSGSDEITRKTVTTNTQQPETPPEYVTQGQSYNVLRNYRLYTYVFTLSALRKEDVNNPDNFKNSSTDFIILKSGGKGTTGLASGPTSAQVEANTKLQTDLSATAESIASSQKNIDTLRFNADLVSGFNKNSPGRFDMFIDDIEIETIMGFSPEGGTTQPTKFSFNVFEPYSINGFVEALHVASVAAGYPTYSGTPFLLKMDFVGYPDDVDLSAPEIVDNATRYFPITITNLEVNLNETGTHYKVAAIASNEAGFGSPTQLKKAIKMSGKTVQEILTNLMDGMNKQVVEADSATNKSGNVHDEYRIIFPDWANGTGFDPNTTNDIAKSEVTELLKDNALYNFPDPGSNTKPTANQPQGQTNPTTEQNASRPESFKLEPSNPVVQFPEGKGLHECISSLIRDSKYVRNIVEKLNSKEWKTVVIDNMIDYFLVKLQVTNKAEIDPDLKRPYQIYTFVVTPHKILYTRVPNYGSQQVDIVKLTKATVRTYDYIYTGKNTEILTFKLNFNNLFFEAIPSALGNDSSPPSRDTAAKNNSINPTSKPENIENISDLRLPAVRRQVDPELTSVDARDNAVPRQDSSYYSLAKGLHKAITNSKASMITGEMEIIGDPVFLVTGGVGGQNPKPSKQSNRLTDNGEANFNFGEVLIVINFKNPIDINPLAEGGLLKFDPELIPFSGVYMITTVTSKFKEGQFKQTLHIIRTPGQPYPTESPFNTGKNIPSDPSERLGTISDPKDVLSDDSTPAREVITTDTGVYGNRAGTLNLLKQLNRGLASPGLPGELSNFTAATGGLGGTVRINQVSGAVTALAGNTRLRNQGFGGIIPGGVTQLAQGIPMSAAGVVNLQQMVLRPAGLVNQVGNTMLSSFGISGPVGQLANQFIQQESRKLNVSPVLGSGIGVGATFNYVPQTLPAVTAYDQISNPIAIAPTAIPVSGIASAMDSRSLSQVIGMNNANVTSINVDNIQKNAQALAENNALLSGKSVYDAAAISGLAGKVAGANALANLNLSSLNGSNNLPPVSGISDLVGQTGINSNQLSGLSQNIQSKLESGVSNIVNSIPADTNLSQAVAQGITIDSLNSDGLKHLPPTTPYSVAPLAKPDELYLGHLAATGGIGAVARSFGVSDISQIPQDQLSAQDAQTLFAQTPAYAQSGLITALQPNVIDSVANATKYLTVNNQLANITGLAGTHEGQLLALQNRFPGSPVSIVANLGSSVASKFGSKSSGQRPLDKIMIR